MSGIQQCRDDSFGPWAGSNCRGGFDFTVLFEETILSILVSTLFILLAPFKISITLQQPVKARTGLLGIVKYILTFCYCVLSLCLVVIWAAYDDTTRTRATIASSALALAAALLYAPLSVLEHGRSIRPPFLLSVFIGFTVLLDLPRVRTLWMLSSPHSNTIAGVFTASFAVRFALVVAETIEKAHLLGEEEKDASKESLSGPFNRAFFAWLNPLIAKGYGNIFQYDDLYSLDNDLQSEKLRDTLTAVWSKVPDKKAGGVLFSAWISAFLIPFLLPVFSRLCAIGFTYAQPFLVTAAIQVADSPEEQPFNNYGYGLIGAYFLVYTGNAIAIGQYEWQYYRAAVIMRGSLVSMIYDKALTIDAFATDVFSPSSTLTLASTDIQVISTGIVQLHETWSNLIEIGVAIYLLERQLGVACVMVVALSFVVLFGSSFLAIPTGTSQAAWNEASENRVTTTSSILANIKWIKISGLTDVTFDIVRKLRRRELAISERFRWFISIALLLALCTPICGPFLTFGMYAGLAQGNSSLDFSRVFTALSVMYLINSPLTKVVSALPQIAGAVASFQRIQDYLGAEERKDTRRSLSALQSAHSDSNKGTETESSRQNSTDEKSALRTDMPTNVVATIEGKFEVPAASTEAKPAEGAENGTTSSEAKATEGEEKGNSDDNPPEAEQEKAKPRTIIDITPRLDFPSQSMTLVLGPVGCGKSTVLKALLGELPDFKGTVTNDFVGAVAYCDQKPWLQNETVKGVIVGALGDKGGAGKLSPADEEWYQRVVKACELGPDIESWPEGEQTPSGSSGAALSGGQKQRLALARALYSRRQILILDDVYSALDARTENLVFENIHGPDGLARKANMTVILASSDARKVPYADKVVILDAKGQLERVGTPAELSGVISDLEISIKPAKGSEDKAHDSQAPVQAAETDPVTAVITKTEAGGPPPGFENVSDSPRRGGGAVVYQFYAKAAGVTSLLAFVGAMTVFAFCDAFPSIWLEWWSKADVKNPGADLGKWLGVYSVLVFGAIVSCCVALWVLFIVIINRSGAYFHDALADKVSKASMAFHTATDVGTTVNRFSQDLQLIDMELPPAVLLASMAAAFGVAQIVIISASSKYMAIFLPFLIIAFYLLGHVYLRTGRQLRLLDIEYKAPLYSQLMDTVAGITTIRSFGWEGPSRQQYMQTLQVSQRPYYLLFCVQRWLTFAVNMLIMVFAVILVVFATQLREQIGAGYVGVALSNVLAFNFTAQSVIQSWVQLEISLGAVARVRTFVETTEVEDDEAAAALESKGSSAAQLQKPEENPEKFHDWPAQGAVDLDGVTASYSSSGKVLDQITLSIQPGQKVAICGRTGSGKSSLLHSLLGILQLDSGAIRIDGQDIATLPRDFIRKKLVAVPQETFVFDETVRFNVDPRIHSGAEETGASSAERDADITRSLQAVGLWDTVESLGGLDAKIRDKLLSHGQVQLLALARAMMRRNAGRLLLLDEMTSGLDETTRQKVDKVVAAEFQDWTVIAIGHRIESILDYDRVIVLDGGKLVEFDEPQTLLAQDDSWFKKLYLLSKESNGSS